MSDYHDLTRRSWDAKAAKGWGESSDPAPEFVDWFQMHGQSLGPKVLDIGTGKGRYAIFLAEQGLEVTALDISKEMVEGAQRKAQAAGVNINIAEGESSRLGFPDRSFDSAVSMGAIHHNKWAEIQQSFREAARVLKPGATFIFWGRSVKDTTRERQPVEDSGFTAVDVDGSKEGVIQHYFTLEELEQLADESGFEVVGEPKEILKEEEGGKVHARWWAVFRKNNFTN